MHRKALEVLPGVGARGGDASARSVVAELSVAAEQVTGAMVVVSSPVISMLD